MASSIDSNTNLNPDRNKNLSNTSYVFSSPLKRTVSRVYSQTGEAPVSASKKLCLDSSLPLKTNVPPTLQQVIKQIEDFLVKTGSSELLLIQQHILKITEHVAWSVEKKYAELGVLYFYVTSGKKLPQADSLVWARVKEITQEANELKVLHTQLCEKKGREQLASGYVIYIQRALARMILTSQGDFNLAGCFAVRGILRSSLSLLLTEEHLEQILGVVCRLIEDPKFRALLQYKFTLHPDMEKLILIDMKLPCSEKIELVYVQWDMLIALFSVTGQRNEKSCYAFASLSYLMRDQPKEMLGTMIETLRTGKCLFNEVGIPIFAIFECSKKYASDFRTRISSDKATQLTSYTVACDSMGIKPLQQEESSHPISVATLLEKTFGSDVEYAKEIILSHKHNLLQQMILSILHFAINNSSERRLFNSIDSVSPKMFFCGLLFKFLTAEFNKIFPPEILQSQEYKSFCSVFSTACTQTLFMADFVNGNIILKNDRFTFEFHSQGFEAYGAMDNYLPFLQIRRLFFLEEGKLYPVDKLSSLASYLVKLAHASIVHVGQAERSLFFSRFIGYLLSPQFQQIAAKIVTQLNTSKVNFDWSKYDKADSCILVSNGGDARLLFNRFSSDRCTHVRICTAKDPFTFFTEICNKISEHATCNSQLKLRSDALLLIYTDNHTFTLTPERFKKYWNNPASVETTLCTPGKIILEKKLTEEQKKRILSASLAKSDVEHITASLPTGELSVREFGKAVRHLIAPDDHFLFNQALGHVMCTVPASTIKRALPQILTALELHMDSHAQALVSTYLDNKEEGVLFTPYEVALQLRRALIVSNAIVLPLNLIENAIRSLYGFPAIIDLGNLNWFYQEKADEFIYERFVLQFDFASEKLDLCSRYRGESKVLKGVFFDALYKPFDLFLSN
jgi:hypothetical protein